MALLLAALAAVGYTTWKSAATGSGDAKPAPTVATPQRADSEPLASGGQEGPQPPPGAAAERAAASPAMPPHGPSPQSAAVSPAKLSPPAPPPASQTSETPANPPAPETTLAGGLATAQTRLRQAQHQQYFDPRNDGWESEDLAEKIGGRLKAIVKAIQSGEPVEAKSLEELVSDDFRCQPLRPAKLEPIHDDGVTRVWRAAQDVAGEATVEDGSFDDSSGASARLARAINELASPLRGAQDAHVKFKVIRVVPEGDLLSATAYYEAGGHLPDAGVQQNAQWTMKWHLQPESAPPRLAEIQVQNYHEARANCPGGTVLQDCTASVLAGNASYQSQIQYGTNHWMERIAHFISPRLLEGHIGVALGDVNGDDLDDLYVCQPAGLPDRLYLQSLDGTLRDISAEAGIDVLDWSSSALVVDLDNDGDQDLVVLTGQGLLLFENDGQARFTAREPVRGAWEYSVTAVDYDTDGRLDLYVCNYFPEATEDISLVGRRDPLHNSNTGGRNVLLRNEGDWRFSDVTAAAGLDANNTRWSYAASWEDYDNDGDMDLYVANDFGPNNLYRYDGGRFTDVAAELGALDTNFGMSVTWGDYNLDGRMDIYVGNMFSSAGNRVTFNDRFRGQEPDDSKTIFQRLARGNTLLENLGDGGFRDVSEEAGVTMGRWSWGSLFADINNDGLDDLLVVNGFLTQDRLDDL